MGANKGDEVFINEIKAGNQAAFEAMVLKYQPRLMSSLVGYTKSVDQAEELCQKTFIKVWQKIHSFRGDSALFTWIYRIGINLAKMTLLVVFLSTQRSQAPLIKMSMMFLNMFHQKFSLLQHSQKIRLWNLYKLLIVILKLLLY
jgi:hypothetical protein